MSSESQNSIEFRQTIPVLRVFDAARSHDFYIGYLGFRVDWEHRFDPDAPLYQQISRAGLTLHLSEHHGDGSPGVRIFVWMTGVEEFHRELQSKNYKYLRPGLETTFYGSKCVDVTDPFGNRISFNERLPPAAESDAG